MLVSCFTNQFPSAPILRCSPTAANYFDTVRFCAIRQPPLWPDLWNLTLLSAPPPRAQPTPRPRLANLNASSVVRMEWLRANPDHIRARMVLGLTDGPPSGFMRWSSTGSPTSLQGSPTQFREPLSFLRLDSQSGTVRFKSPAQGHGVGLEGQ